MPWTWSGPRTSSAREHGPRNQLRTVVPSFNINTQPSATRRPSSACKPPQPGPRSHAHLVNGKRRHRAAVITWLGNGIADGSQGPTSRSSPRSPFGQAEVLRDAARRPVRLRRHRRRHELPAQGRARGRQPGVPHGGLHGLERRRHGTCGSGIIGDIKHSCNGIGGHGRAMSVAGNVGLPLGQTGFVNLSMEYGNATRRTAASSATTRRGSSTPQRQHPEPRPGVGLAAPRGRPEALRQLRPPLQQRLQFYGHTNYAQRKVTGGFYFGIRTPAEASSAAIDSPTARRPCASATSGSPRTTRCTEPTTATPDPAARRSRSSATCRTPAPSRRVEADPNCWTLYSRFPGGFTPQFGGDLIDYSLVTGLRGFAANGFTWDASVNIGTSEVDQFIFDTVNASLGYDTPTSFNPASTGRMTSTQLRRLAPRQRRRERRGRRRVARREVHDRRRRRAVLADRPVRRAGLQLRNRTGSTATAPTPRRANGAAVTSRSTATSNSTIRAAGGPSAPRSGWRTSRTSAPPPTGSSRPASG